MENENIKHSQFTLSIAPHIQHPDNVSKIMMWVLLALIPATIEALYFFGWRAFFHILFAVGFSLGTEAAIQKSRKVPITINDYSAAVTGLLLAFNIPPGAPYWISAVGGIFAITVAKQAFGGLGHNFINPALAARAFLLAAWPIPMTAAWLPPNGASTMSGIAGVVVDGVTSSTPLAVMKRYIMTGMLERSFLQEALSPLFLGNVGGCIGETSALALILGGIVLIYKRYIDIRIPAVYIGTVFVLTWIFNGSRSFFTEDALLFPVYHIFAGGLMLGAFFMATDMVTSPITPVGRVLFGFGCGCLTVIIRMLGGYPEGVCYSILLMNIAAPLLDRVRMPRKYGERKEKSEE